MSEPVLLREGDTVVLLVSNSMTVEQAEQTCEDMEAWLPGVNVRAVGGVKNVIHYPAPEFRLVERDCA